MQTYQRIKSVPRNQSLPLSFAQQRLWFLDQLEPGSSFYNIAAAVRLDGPLNVSALNSAFAEIIRRHESLRTTFASAGGAPRQVIAPELKLTLPVFDLGSLPASEREAEASLRAGEEAQRPFDLSIGPLLRATLLRLTDKEHVLLLTMHHIISDGWSMRVLVREVATLYEAFAAGRPSPLPEPSIQYADYAAWQREWLQGALLEKQIEYWQRRLDGVQPLDLPTDRPRPPVQTYAGARYDFELPAELTRRLKTLGQRAGATLFMTLMAAFQTLLHRYSGQEDICVGTPVAGRTRLDTESVIGFFVNALVLRTTVSSTSSFKQVLARVRDATLEAQTHQDLPFERLVEILQPARDMSRTPFFQVMFALQEAVLESVQLPGLNLSPVKSEQTTAKVDLALLMEETANGLRGSFEFNTDLFDLATVERLTGHFRQLLDAVSDNAEERVSELPLLTAGELQQLLYQWNETTTVYPRDKCVHQLFELQVQRTPDALAVISEDQQLTYRELNKRANQVAHYLQSFGAGPDSPIGIMIERSVELVVGLLGILKAGGAYVPLDPGYPRDRLAFMLEDAGIHHLMTQEQLVGQLPEQLFKPASRITSLDADWSEISRESTDNPASAATPENLAYVMYTSGSTGIPKGVSVNHRSVVRLVQNTNYVDLNSDHTFLQMAPVSFDASTFEIWGSLLNGARLALMAPGVVTSLEELGESLRRYDVTTLWLTAGLFHLMVDQQLDNLQVVKQLLAGGDVLSVPHVKKFLRNVAGGKLVNGYGPTENTTFTCCHLMTDAARIGASVPIGSPISNTQVYVLDGNLRPVPIGVVGELYTSGDGLSRGYLNRAELTAERFVPCPFGDKPGVRLYRTGDLVRWVAGGRIEFLGRRDHQVKLRGFRIELEEIEATLRQQPDVRDAVVVVREKTPGDKRLIAYVTAEGEAVLTPEDLRFCLKEQLPQYMTPHAVVLMEEFPLTPNGKIDRRALPAPATQSESRETFVAPQTHTEKAVIWTWTNILGIEPIGLNDNFFELGGHSLQATRVVSQLREAFQVELSLRSFFETPTVAGLTALIEESRQKNGEGQIGHYSRHIDLPLSFAQERLWFLDQLQLFNSLYNIPVGLSLKGQLDTSTLERTLNEIIRRHESLRTTFTQSEGAPRQVIAPELKLTIPIFDLTVLPAAERETEASLRAKEDAQRPFDLGAGPLLRATLLRLGDDEHVLLLTMHHIISDGWSMGVLVSEVGIFYEAFATGRPSPLPELSIQYADYAVWQREWLQGAVLEKQLDYWKQQLGGAETLQLRTDRERPAVRMYRGARCAFELPEEVSQQAKALGQREGATLFMTLLAGFQILLHHYSGQNDISIGTDIANRKRQEIEGLIGFFINQLVLRTDLSGNPSFIELLKRVRATTLDAYVHQDVPFELLVDTLRVERSLKQSPLFQVKLVLQNTPPPGLELPGLTLHPLEVDYISAKFDLTLLLTETPAGISGYFEYDTDLFTAATVNRLAKQLVELLRYAVAQPEMLLETFKQRLTELDTREKTTERNRRADLNREKLKNTKPRRLSLKPEELVQI